MAAEINTEVIFNFLLHCDYKRTIRATGLKLKVKIYPKRIYKYHVCHAVKFTGMLQLWKNLKLEKYEVQPISLEV
jgi:hypothetical protein